MFRNALIAAGLLLAGAPAQALSSISGSTVLLDPEDPFSFNVNLAATVNNPSGATAHAVFGYLGHDATSKVFNFSYWIQNTSVAPSAGDQLVSVGFNVSPTPLSGSDTDSSDAFLVQYVANPNPSAGNFNGLGPRNVCLYTGSNCSGGAGDGLTAGAIETGGFSLTYNTAQTGTITLSNFVGRWQATNIGSTSGGSVGGGGGSVTPIPEASTWAMMIIGLGGVGGAMRSRRRRSQLAAA